MMKKYVLLFVALVVSGKVFASPCQDWIDTYRNSIVDIYAGTSGDGTAHMAKRVKDVGCDVDEDDVFNFRIQKDPFDITVGFLDETEEVIIEKTFYGYLSQMPDKSVLYFDFDKQNMRCRCEKKDNQTWICDFLG